MAIDIETRYGRYWDSLSVAQHAIWRGLDDGPMKSAALYWLYDRLAKLEAGVELARSHRSVERRFQEVDHNLRLRWEFDHPDHCDDTPIYGMYAVDRFVPEYGYHFTLFFWSHTLGMGDALRQILIESDMQRPEYMKTKKLVQELALERGRKKRVELALQAVDQLTNAQCKQFIEVEKALRSGEKIRSYGKDAEILNRMYDKHKKDVAMGTAVDIPGSQAALNPGMNPTGAGYERLNRE